MAASDTALLSPLDTLMWRLHAEPDLRTSFVTVSLLDRAPDRERLRRRLAWAVADLPHFTERVAASPLPGIPPRWEADPDFSIDRHLEVIDLGRSGEPAGTGAEPAVVDVATRLVAEPFDPERPLWGIVIATGLPGGRAALFHRLHHALTDGEGGIRLSERYLDADPDAPHPSDHEVPDPFPGGPPSEQVTPLERATLFVADRAGEAARGAAVAARWAVQGVRDPTVLVTASAAAVDAARSLGRQLAIRGGQRSPAWRGRSGQRRFLVATIPFEAVRSIATATATSVNDVFVTATVRAAGAVHREAGHPVDELRVAVPVSTRRRDGPAARSTGGNAVAPTSTLLPTGGALTAGAHLREVSARLADIRTQRSNQLVGALSAGAGLLPTPVIADAVRHQTSAIDLVTSNVRAAPFPLWVAGARIESTHVVGPLLGTPVNVTMMSYDGRADLGIHVDAGAVADPEGFRDRVVDAVAELAAGEGVPRISSG